MDQPADPTLPPPLRAWFSGLDAVLAYDIDGRDDRELKAELAAIETATRRLQARSTRIVGTITTRRVRRAREASPKDDRAGDRARKAVQRELNDEQDWTHSKAKETCENARNLPPTGPLADAFAAGELSDRHIRVITETLRHMDEEHRDDAITFLLAAAREQDPVTFGRTARGYLAKLDAEAAEEQAERVHRRRYGRVAQGPDGMTHLHLGTSGLDGEVLQQAIDIFRTPDAPGGQLRTPEQRTADAVVAAMRHALDHHAEPGRARPHVTVQITWAELCASAGVAETRWSGGVPASEIRRLLDDSTISRLITGPDSLPIDIGRASRTIATGTWRAIVARDRGCTFPGCDAPPSWCDGAHLERRWVDGAGTSAAEIGLLCRTHHRHVDHHAYTGRITAGQVTWTRPGRTEADTSRQQGSDPDPP